MVKFLRAFTETTLCFSVDHPTIGKEYLVNVVYNHKTDKSTCTSLTVNGENVEDEDERAEVLKKLLLSRKFLSHSLNPYSYTPMAAY